MNAQEVYMTAFTSKSYIPGVIALKKSLINTKTKHPLVILIPSNEANDLINVLKKHNVLDKNCFYLVKPSLDEKYFRTLKNEWRFSHWNKTFFKLAVTSCVEFKKIILLDSDLYIQKNIDHLFKAPHYSAVPSRINGQLTGGLIVLEPNVALYKKLLSFIKTAIKKRQEAGLSTGDQNVFRYGMPGWDKKKELILPETYGCYIGFVRDVSRHYKIKIEDIYVIHFWGKIKPWRIPYVFNILRICFLHIFKPKKAKIYAKYVSLLRS